MIYLHIFILFVFLILFFLSAHRKAAKQEGEKRIVLLLPFKKLSMLLLSYFLKGNSTEIQKKIRLLNPAGAVFQETRQYYVKKMSEALLLIFAGNLLGMLISVMDMQGAGRLTGNAIRRNSYGEGEEVVELDTRIGDEKLEDRLEITVDERQYTEAEIQEKFEAEAEKLPTLILGENTSLDRVEHDLDLIKVFPDNPIEISWEVDNYDLMDSEGRLQEDAARDGTVLMLNATFSYFESHYELELPVRVYPKARSREEGLKDAILNKIQKYDVATAAEESLILPTELGGVAVSYQDSASHTGAYILLMAVLMGIVLYYGRDKDLTKQVEKREKEMMLDYPEIVSKLTLLFGAGMTIRGAFEKIAGDYEKQLKAKKLQKSYAYEEMLITVREMQSGISEFQAYNNFGNRSGVRHFNKLGTMLSQNLQKGSSGLLSLLQGEVKEAFEERKAMARKLGEEAGTKLLLPMGIMLLIVMVIVIVPAFLSFSL